MMERKNAIVIGAGIVGLAAARALALAGYKVDVFEKNEKAVGASIRNFGMVWPVGQPVGHLYDRAIRSRDIWVEICEGANIWNHRKGSLHLAYEADELMVLEEFIDLNAEYRNVRLLNNDDILSMSPAVNPVKLKGGFYSGDEVIVDARVAIEAIPHYFTERMDINFHFLEAITAVEEGAVWAGKQKFQADAIYICSGAEFESLFPEIYLNSPLTRCKLQMMRSVAQPEGFNMGPSLCGGLTLLHYKAFQDCPSLPKLVSRMRQQYPEYMEHGIHVMAAQNGNYELTIGDSHEYGFTLDPFDRDDVNQLILDYLKKFLVLPDFRMQQTWNGTYVKMVEGTELVLQPLPGVTIVNGLGGAGMTLSFGLLEEIVSGHYKM